MGQNSHSQELHNAFKSMSSSSWDFMCDINSKPTSAVNEKFKEVLWLLIILKTNLAVSKRENRITVLECILQDSV